MGSCGSVHPGQHPFKWLWVPPRKGHSEPQLRGNTCIFFLLQHQKASCCSSGLRQRWMWIKDTKVLAENYFWTQLLNIHFNQISGWLVISSNPLSLHIPARSRERGQLMDLSTFGGHHHLLFLQGLLETQVWGPFVYIYTSWKKRSKVSSSNQKRPLKPNWHTGSRGGAGTNSQFHKRPKGSLEKWTGREDEATPHFLFCWGLSMAHQSLS